VNLEIFIWKIAKTRYELLVIGENTYRLKVAPVLVFFRIIETKKAFLFRGKPLFIGERKKFYFFDASIDTFLNSFNNFSRSKELLRARVPAALLPFSTCKLASVAKASNSALILLTNFSILNDVWF